RDGRHAVLHLPVLAVLPLGEILAVEEHDRIRRRIGIGLARRDHLRFGPDDTALVFNLLRPHINRPRGSDCSYDYSDGRPLYRALADHRLLRDWGKAGLLPEIVDCDGAEGNQK